MREQAEPDATMARRAARTAATGKKPGGRPPAPPQEGPRPTDQVNPTDEASRLLPVAGGGFEPCHTAQAAVAGANLLGVAPDVVQAANDRPLEAMDHRLKTREGKKRHAANKREHVLASGSRSSRHA